MPIQYDPHTQYRGDLYTAQMFNSLNNTINDYFRKQQEAQLEADQLAYQKQRNDVIMNHAHQLGYVTPEQWLEYQQKNPKQQQGYAEGIAANIATDQALKNQAI